MDLKRSVNFFDSTNHDVMKQLLMNVALAYPELNYFQGMNYIAIFLYGLFGGDLNSCFRFFCYIIERFLIPNFSARVGGLLKLVWTQDRLIELQAHKLWQTLSKADVSSAHYATPNIGTLMTCLIKSPSTKPLVPPIWDLMLGSGIFFIYEMLMYVLDVQKAHIDQIETDELLSAMQHVDSDPFAILRGSGLISTALDQCLSHLTKENLMQIDYDSQIFDQLEFFYNQAELSIVNALQ